jgi:heme-degrading monooxygenase HmoA
MIVRSWSARSSAAGAKSYIAHFRRTVLPSLQRIAGQRGAVLLRRGVASEVELVVLTFWDSMDSIHEFAGKDASLAVVEPEAKAALQKFDTQVQHFDLVLDTRA